MMNIDRIFLGVTPVKQRHFLKNLFQHLRKKGYNRIVITTVGEFHNAHSAIEAGFEPHQIETSDVGLYSSLIGYLASGQNIEKLGFKVKAPYDKQYAKFKDDTERVAYLFLLMKLAQLRTTVYYEKEIRDELEQNILEYTKKMKKILEAKVERLKGISYTISDLRVQGMRPDLDEKTIFVTDPPVYKGGYTKMFAFDELIEWECPIDEWLPEEYDKLWDAVTHDSKCLGLFVKYHELPQRYQYNAIYAEERSDRFDYWLCTNMEELEGFDYKGYVNFKGAGEFKRLKKEIYADQEITEDSKIRIIPVEAGTSLYYRELWCHKLGNSKAELYYIILLDDRVLATVAFHAGDLRRLRSTQLFNVYAYATPSKRYRNLNRLVSYIITSTFFKEQVEPTLGKMNRVYDLRGMKTTCLSRYNRVKSNTGIFQVREREKQDDGLYKIVYHTDFHKRSEKDILRVFLNEDSDYQAKQQ